MISQQRVAGLSSLAIIAISLGAFTLFHRSGGFSPVLWYDTTAEQDWVERCLREGECSATGVGSSIPGINHGTSWMRFRAMLEALGMDLGVANVVTQCLDAIGVGLAAHTAARISGPIAGALAATAYVSLEKSLDLSHDVLFNCRIVPFLSALFTALLLAYVVSGRLSLGLATAFVFATVSDLYVASIALFPVLVLVGLLSPCRRTWIKLLIPSTAIVMLFLLSPFAWWENFTSAIQRFAGMKREMEWDWFDAVFIAITAFTIAAALFTKGGVQAKMLATLAICLGVPLVLYEGAKISGITGRSAARYLLPLISTIAVAGASAFISIAKRLFSSKWLKWPTVSLPYVIAFGLAVWPIYTKELHRTFTYEDARKIQQLLMEEYGWGVDKLLTGVRSPHLRPMLLAFLTFPPYTTPPTREEDKVAYVFKLVEPYPNGWQIVKKLDEIVIAMTNEWLDWGDFEICDEAGCRNTGLRVTPRMLSHHELVLEGMPNTPAKVVLKVPYSGPADETRTFCIPRVPGACLPSGLSIAGTSEGGRSVTIHSGPEGARGLLEVTVNIGEPDCTIEEAGFLPLVIEYQGEERISLCAD